MAEKTTGRKNMYDISFVVPSIRTDLWRNLYDSINKSFTCGSWELIFIGPYDQPKEMEFESNVRCIADWGSPVRCRHIGLINSHGTWMCLFADDSTFFPEEINKAFVKTIDVDYKTIIMAKYMEGVVDNNEMRQEQYYTFGYHGMFNYITQWIPRDYKLIQHGLLSTRLLKEVGGWDCRFEVCAIACSDLSVRLQNHDTNIIIHDEPLCYTGHGHSDHRPIEEGIIQNDLPLFNKIYSSNNYKQRVKINLNNWEDSPKTWKRRYK